MDYVAFQDNRGWVHNIWYYRVELFEQQLLRVDVLWNTAASFRPPPVAQSSNPFHLVHTQSIKRTHFSIFRLVATVPSEQTRLKLED